MKNKIILLILAFLLTTVCGTFLGAYFQDRQWRNQWEVKKEELNVDQKKEIYEHISSLLDKRQYRMRQFLWALQERFDNDYVESRRREYREVLYEWNENLNRNFALLQMKFDEELRNVFEDEIGFCFIKAGESIEELYRKRMNEGKVDIAEVKSVESDLDDLHIKIYKFNLDMLSRI
jgi:hypothetical protein